ncbi:hypothetical protein VNI00_001417 [Paramarasmius palmivorus]|uniref:Uncharacterized protein n=1 Tax=Paramarasmius palmivorus TaxID=297713 RepID=A0AAW0E0X7_9AGAR
MNNHQESSSFSLPFVTPVVRRLDVLSQELLENSHSTDILRPSSLTQDRALSAAFALLVLLQFRDQRIHQQRSLLTPWDRWTQESEAEKEICIIDKHIERVWEQWFLDAYCSPKEIETVLWTAFPLEEDKDKTVRVVDFLAKDDPPVYLLTHRVVQYSLFNYWKRGPSVDLATARHYLTTKYDAFYTPR